MVRTSCIAFVALACSSPPRPASPVPVTVVPIARRADLERSLRDLDPAVELSFADLPNRPKPPPLARTEADALARARASYIDADFDACMTALTRPPSVADLLAADRRDVAARKQFWLTACALGGGQRSLAERSAEQFATFSFALPGDVDSVSPDVELLLARAIETVGERAPIAVHVVVDVDRARVSVDGVPATCTTPCTVDVSPGDHVVGVDADGIEPVARLVRAAPPRTTVSFAASPASPEQAARQWMQRYASSVAVDSAASASLLARAVRAKRLVLLHPAGEDLRAVLIDGGKVTARVERRARDLPADSRALLRDLLVEGRLMPAPAPVWRRPAFWVAIGIASALGAFATGVALHDPPTRTEVVFGGPP